MAGCFDLQKLNHENDFGMDPQKFNPRLYGISCTLKV